MAASTTEAASDMTAAATTTTVAASAASAARQGIGRKGGCAKREGRSQDDCFMERDYSHEDSPLGC
jgi:hypothetical protein